MPLLIEGECLDFALLTDEFCARGLDLDEVARKVDPQLDAGALRYRLRKYGFDLKKGRVRLGATGEPITDLIARGDIERRQDSAGDAA